MTIREQVEDASFLEQNGRYVGALDRQTLEEHIAGDAAFGTEFTAYGQADLRRTDQRHLRLRSGENADLQISALRTTQAQRRHVNSGIRQDGCEPLPLERPVGLGVGERDHRDE